MFTWQQKANHATNWDDIETNTVLWPLIEQAQQFKTGGVAHSGQTGIHFTEQRIIDDHGGTYSVGLTQPMCELLLH